MEIISLFVANEFIYRLPIQIIIIIIGLNLLIMYCLQMG